MSKIILMTASNGKNLELTNKLHQICSELGVESEICQLTTYNFPLFHIDEEKLNSIPPNALELTEKLEKARAIIIVAPEYNGLIPPVLNNAIAWVSRSKEDWRGAFNGKVCAIATHSGSGGLHALTAMRQQLSYLGATVLGRQIHTHYKKEFSEKSALAVIEQLIKITN